jgi:hypothetical protein
MNPNPDPAPHPGFQWQKVGIAYRRNDFVTNFEYISSMTYKLQERPQPLQR